MKRTFIGLLSIISLFIFAFAQPSFAADLDSGAKIFKANCVACHMLGNNSVMKEKTLRLEALQKFNMYSLEAIMTQVTNGKNVMPAFGKKLSKADIENVASYVLAQADNGWKKK